MHADELEAVLSAAKMETVIYPCGCSATGTAPIPRNCPGRCLDKVEAVLSAEPRQQDISPIPLTTKHEQSIKEWAADDRLWTTQETVEFNLRTFARTILKEATEPRPPAAAVDLRAQLDAADEALGFGYFPSDGTGRVNAIRELRAALAAPREDQ
jgi:hypothetical protein